MSWAVGYDENWNRDIGYGVPAICDSPNCTTAINRGLAYACGSEPYGGEKGCGLFFCDFHMSGYSPQLCTRCRNHKTPYNAKPDTPEWINHKMTDPSWETWRNEQRLSIQSSKV